MKKLSFAGIVLMVLVISCDKIKDDEDIPTPTPPAVTGTFTFKGESNTGNSTCNTDLANYPGTGLAASIELPVSGYIKFLHMGNLPASGSVTVSDKYDANGCMTCPVISLAYGPMPYDVTDSYISWSGTVSKTATGYSFNAMMIRSVDMGIPNPPKFALNGSLNCQ